MNIVKQFATAIYKFHDYPYLLLNKWSKVIFYYIVMTLLVMVVTLVPVYNKYRQLGGATGVLNKYLPEFTISNGKLDCDTIEYNSDDNSDGILVYVNTKDKFDFNKKIENSASYFIADSEEFTMYNGIQKVNFKFADLPNNMNKKSLVNILTQKSNLVIFFGTGLFFALLANLIMGLFSIVCLALFGSILNNIVVRANIRLSHLYKLSIYARTFPVLLAAILSIIGIDLNIIVYIGLLATYMYLGLKNIKNNPIDNNQDGIIIAEFLED